MVCPWHRIFNIMKQDCIIGTFRFSFVSTHIHQSVDVGGAVSVGGRVFSTSACSLRSATSHDVVTAHSERPGCCPQGWRPVSEGCRSMHSVPLLAPFRAVWVDVKRHFIVSGLVYPWGASSWSCSKRLLTSNCFSQVVCFGTMKWKHCQIFPKLLCVIICWKIDWW